MISNINFRRFITWEWSIKLLLFFFFYGIIITKTSPIEITGIELIRSEDMHMMYNSTTYNVLWNQDNPWRKKKKMSIIAKAKYHKVSMWKKYNDKKEKMVMISANYVQQTRLYLIRENQKRPLKGWMRKFYITFPQKRA